MLFPAFMFWEPIFFYCSADNNFIAFNLILLTTKVFIGLQALNASFAAKAFQSQTWIIMTNFVIQTKHSRKMIWQMEALIERRIIAGGGGDKKVKTTWFQSSHERILETHQRHIQMHYTYQAML